MNIDLSGFRSIRAANFVKIEVPGDPIFVSDFGSAYVLSGDNYTDIGSLLGITGTESQIRAAQADVTVTISGIPNENINQVLSQKIKGSTVTITRAYFNPTTNVLLSIAGNPAIAFRGVVNNISVSDSWDASAGISTFTIAFSCTNEVGVIANRVSGRRTNGRDQRKYFPNDPSLDRVSAIARSNFNFGAPR